MAEGC